jgi:hypothetical protein
MRIEGCCFSSGSDAGKAWILTEIVLTCRTHVGVGLYTHDLISILKKYFCQETSARGNIGNHVGRSKLAGFL